MPDAANLVTMMKEAAVAATEATKPVAVCFGEVVSASPLKIRVDSKLELGGKQLILCEAVTDHETDMTVEHETDEGLDVNISHTHEYTGETAESGDPLHNHDYSGETAAGADNNLVHVHGYAGTKTFAVNKRLKVGDKVVLLRMQGGQKYLVLDRVVGI